MRRENLLEEVRTDSAVSGRSFVKWSAALGGTAALAGGGFSLLQAAPSVAAAGAPENRLDSPQITNG